MPASFISGVLNFFISRLKVNCSVNIAADLTSWVFKKSTTALE
jgi:hypothetical protein